MCSLREISTLSWEIALQNYLTSFSKGVYTKRKEFVPEEQILSF